MELSNFLSLNPTCERHKSKKLFHGKYLYRAVFKVICARVAQEKDIVKGIQRREHWDSLRINSFGYRQLYSVKDVNREQLVMLKKLLDYNKSECGGSYKIRIEEPYVSVYSNDLEFIQDIIDTDPVKDSLIELHCPENQRDETLILAGKSLTSKAVEFKYQVFINMNKLPSDVTVRAGILSYLDNLGNEVAFSDGLRRDLGRQWSYSSSRYFYTKDQDLITMLGIMAPGAIAKIVELAENSGPMVVSI